MNPREVTVALNGQVNFVNDDSRPHDVFSDPDHLVDPANAGTDCPSVTRAGYLNPGQSRATDPLTIARRCGYHDHLTLGDPTFRGTIVVVVP